MWAKELLRRGCDLNGPLVKINTSANVKLATEQNIEMWKWVKEYKSGKCHSESGEANLNLDSQNLTYIYIC